MAIVTAQQYRDRRSPRDFVTLTNGDRFEVRPVDTLQLALAQDLDADEIDALMALMKTAAETGDLSPLRMRSDRIAAFIDVIVSAGAVSPVIVRTKQGSDSDALGIDEIDLVDKLALLVGITRATEKKATLLQEQMADLTA